jgi:hypothetical protein
VDAALPFHLAVIFFPVDVGRGIALPIDPEMFEPDIIAGQIEIRLIALRLVRISFLVFEIDTVEEKKVKIEIQSGDVIELSAEKFSFDPRSS